MAALLWPGWRKSLLTIFLFFLITDPISTYRVVIEHPIEVTEDGSVEKVVELSKVWRDKVLLKNEYILKVEYLLEKKRANRYLLLVIYHYKDRDSAKLAADAIGPLIEAAWPDEEARHAFFRELQRYMVQDEKVIHRFDVL